MPAKRKNATRFSELSKLRWSKSSDSSEHNSININPPSELDNDNSDKEFETSMSLRLETNIAEAEIPIEDVNVETDEYIFIQTSILQSLFSAVVCKVCYSNRVEVHVIDANYGFAKKVEVQCKNCEESGLECTLSSSFTSNRIKNKGANGQDVTGFDINYRISMAFLQIGKGYNGIELFSMIMNVRPFSKSTFFSYQKSINQATNEKIKEIMETARSKVRNEHLAQNLEILETEEMIDLTVSYDGSWMTRGHSSLLGVGCVIDVRTGYVIDFEIMSKYCHECVLTKIDLGEDSLEFDIWMEGHKSKCQKNHSGSSGAMEMAAAVEIWRRSENFGFRYSTMLSDGDAKTLVHLNDMHVYGENFVIEKEECVNHVKKR